jgi:hypothetical protein
MTGDDMYQTTWLLIVGTTLTLGAPFGRAAEEKPPYETRDAYQEQRVEGWTVLVNKRLFEKDNQELRERVLRVLGDDLFRITRVLPAEPLAKLRKVPFWVELAHPRHACMCYHVSADWLREHHMNPDKAGAVEIANCKNFLSWSEHTQPWMVLHELAHAYHQQVLTFDHAEIKACYDQAVASKTYESVLHINGETKKHYALTNHHEYFAEATEAYFGTNDFYPFVRSELKRHDPRLYDVLEKVWGVRKPMKD